MVFSPAAVAPTVRVSSAETFSATETLGLGEAFAAAEAFRSMTRVEVVRLAAVEILPRFSSAEQVNAAAMGPA